MNKAKSSIGRCAVALAVAGMMALPGLAIAARVDEVIAKFIEATGGREAQVEVLDEGFFDIF